jgi:hypothetical protein
MSAETELYAALSASAGLAALVSTRIYPDAIPENKALPAVVYSLDGAAPIYGLGNEKHATPTQIKIVAWGTTRTAASAVGDEIALALIAISLPADNRYSGFDAEVGEYADVTEITWWE